MGLILAVDILALFFQVLTMYLCDDAIYFRFNSIDMKYQVWKLGVVFTDNVSSVVCNISWLLLSVFVCALLFLHSQDKGVTSCSLCELIITEQCA